MDTPCVLASLGARDPGNGQRYRAHHYDSAGFLRFFAPGVGLTLTTSHVTPAASAITHAMKTAIPSAIGVETSNARNDEYNVPQMNGSAPNSPDTGSHVLCVQNEKPNFRMERRDDRSI